MRFYQLHILRKVFLVHYWSGRNIFEENPVDYSVIGEIQKYQITFSEHSNDYDFYNSESLMDDFLFNVKNRIKYLRVWGMSFCSMLKLELKDLTVISL